MMFLKENKTGALIGILAGGVAIALYTNKYKVSNSKWAVTEIAGMAAILIAGTFAGAGIQKAITPKLKMPEKK